MKIILLFTITLFTITNAQIGKKIEGIDSLKKISLDLKHDLKEAYTNYDEKPLAYYKIGYRLFGTKFIGSDISINSRQSISYAISKVNQSCEKLETRTNKTDVYCTLAEKFVLYDKSQKETAKIMIALYASSSDNSDFDYIKEVIRSEKHQEYIAVLDAIIRFTSL